MFTHHRKARAAVRAVCLLLLLLFALPALAQAPQDTLTVRLFKAGKADAFLIRTGGQVILIDTAEDDDAHKVLDYMADEGIPRIDTLIITHFDKGHIGGAADILDAVPVGRVLMPDHIKQSGTHTAFQKALARSDALQLTLKEDAYFTAGDTHFDITVARAKHYPEDEDDGFSLVTRATHGEHTLLFTGDVPASRIRELMAQDTPWQADFLQVPAHGRDGPMTEAFLRAVSPRYAVITCSDKNPPAPAVLAVLERLNTQTWLTVDGHIDLVSDGKTLTIDQ